MTQDRPPVAGGGERVHERPAHRRTPEPLGQLVVAVHARDLAPHRHLPEGAEADHLAPAGADPRLPRGDLVHRQDRRARVDGVALDVREESKGRGREAVDHHRVVEPDAAGRQRHPGAPGVALRASPDAAELLLHHHEVTDVHHREEGPPTHGGCGPQTHAEHEPGPRPVLAEQQDRAARPRVGVVDQQHEGTGRLERLDHEPRAVGPGRHHVADVEVLELRHDPVGTRSAAVVDPVEAVPPGAPVPAHLHDPGPDGLGGRVDDDRPRRVQLGARDQVVAGHRAHEVRVRRAPPQVPRAHEPGVDRPAGDDRTGDGAGAFHSRSSVAPSPPAFTGGAANTRAHRPGTGVS